MDHLERFRGCLLGLAVGDAIGTSVEFKPRGQFIRCTGMAGGGPFHLRPGQWTDDTSMALCLATSLAEKGGFDARDQMERYVRWREEGYLSSNGRCFDIGGTTATALDRFRQTGDPFAGSADPHSAGNGSIMRLAPIPMFYHRDIRQAIHYAAESSRTTHAASECQDACRLLAGTLVRALEGGDKDWVLDGASEGRFEEPKIDALARREYEEKAIGRIRGTGYVVDCLEAALWCFLHTNSFSSAVLEAANLGDDADTTAAVCGQIAGAYYGLSEIPLAWLETLAHGMMILDLADSLYRKGAGH